MYKLNQNSVIRLADGASIPFADGNRDYEEYKQWLSEGNTPEPEFTETELAQQVKDKAIQEALAYLVKTNHKFYIGYIPKEDEDLVSIHAKREEALLFIRDNK